MIIQKTIEVSINAKNIKHYESIGYHIPKHKNKKRWQFKKGTKIKIEVGDLPIESHHKILCSCDICGRENNVRYQSLHKSSKYVCSYCTSSINIKKSKSRKNIKHTEESKLKMRINHRDFNGSKNPNYNHNISIEERKHRRNEPGKNRWRKNVLQRDNYTCQKCGSNKNLQAHHINNWKHFKEQRTDTNNGITLCQNCHKQIHHIFGLKTERVNLEKFLQPNK